MSNESDTSPDTLNSVKDIIYDIENRSADGDYINTYESIADFEQQNDIDLPEDIAAMLTA